MALILINDVSIRFGGPRLLDGVTLRIENGERIGLLGRNGMGDVHAERVYPAWYLNIT